MNNSEIDLKFQELRESDERFNAKLELIKELEVLLEPHYPECKLIPFGSTFAKLALASSDLDVLLLIPNQSLRGKGLEYRVLQQVSRLLPRHRFRIKELVDANVPLLIFEVNHPSCGRIEIDLSCSDGKEPKRLCFQGTLLLRAYVELDERFRKLFVIIKTWADKKSMLGTRYYRLNPYALALMLIYYLQDTYPQVLPNLQEEYRHDFPRMVESWQELETIQDENLRKFISNYSSKNQDSLSALLKGFFQFYSEFNFDEIISIRKRNITFSECKDYSRKHGEFYDAKDWDKYIRIEEPFFRFNVTRVVRKVNEWSRIRDEFKRALRAYGNGGITSLFSYV